MKVMESMIERVAKAMAAKEGWRWDDERQMLDCAAAGLQNTSRERDTWRNRARAAIEEMRTPTEAMKSASYMRGFEAEEVYQAMIDAAINEEEGKAV